MSETALAFAAAVRFLARVDAHVAGEGGFLIESLIALFAFERLLSRVNAHVFGELALVGEALVTHGAPMFVPFEQDKFKCGACGKRFGKDTRAYTRARSLLAAASVSVGSTMQQLP